LELEPRTTAPAHATGAVEFVPVAAIAADATFRLREEGDVAALAASIGRLGQLAPVELRPMPGAADGAPRFQVVAGFRRIAAVKLLMRGRVLARVHRRLDDEDAWGLALGQALLTEPLDRDALDALRERLATSGAVPWADELVDEALVRAPLDEELRERFFAFLGGAPAEAPASGTPDEGSAGDEVAPGAETQMTDEQDAADGEPEPGDPSDDPTGDPEVEVITPEELADGVASRMYEVNADLSLAFEAWSDLPPQGRRMILEQARWLVTMLPHLEQREEESEDS
jgi:hypothetical protein